MRAERHLNLRSRVPPQRAAAPAALLWLSVAALLLVAGTWVALRSGRASAARRDFSTVTVPPPPPSDVEGFAGAHTVRDPARAHEAATRAEPPAMLMRQQLRKMQEYAENRGAGDPLAPTPAAIEEFRRRDNPYVW